MSLDSTCRAAALLLSSSLAGAAPVFAQCGAADRPLISEVFYDAVGDDSGLEFVELFNAGAAPVALAGVRLEAGDGSAPGRWSVRWTGAARDTIAPGMRFVVGGARVQPAPAVIATLDLQNGPDAVRLVWADGVSEVVGYGVQEFSEYACGTAADDAASGLSLARIPDAARTGSNATDFRPATPSPGRANQPDRDAAVIAGSLSIEPGQPEPGAAMRVRARLVSRGALGFPPGDVSVQLGFQGVPLLDRDIDARLARGDTLVIDLVLPAPAAGAGELIARVTAIGDEDSTDDRDSLRVRIGAGPLEVTEIQFHPAHGEGEWVEVRNGTSEPVDPAAFLYGDRAGAKGAIHGGAAPIAPGGYAVVAQDRVHWRAAFPGADSTRVFAVSPWAALNNANDANGIADVVTIRERDGTPCAAVPYSATGIPDGVPVERAADGRWGPDSDPMGTPLAAPHVLPPLARTFRAAPRRWRAGAAAATTLEWSLPWAAAALEVIAYDFAGRRVAVIVPPEATPARGQYRWHPALGPGVYVLALDAHAATGQSLGASEAVRVTGVAP